jgi:2-polyprenyl-3-methyl-5-hydroxy-6-metoxy-1,4-benzoquinol methylase
MDSRNQEMEKELAFQAERAAKFGKIMPTPDYVFERYRKSSLPGIFPKEKLFRSLQDMQGKQILDMGCGEGELSTQLARLGARVTGIDISPELIRVAQRRAELDGVQNQTEFLVWNILEKPLPENRFDLITCSAVLHHVDIRQFLPVLWASLRPGGVAVMIEPLGLSPWLRKLRARIPVNTDASPGEHPLTRQELNHIVEVLGNARTTYYELFSRLQVFLPNRNRIDSGHPFTKAVLISLGCVDRFLLDRFQFCRSLAGEAVIVGRKENSGVIRQPGEGIAGNCTVSLLPGKDVPLVIGSRQRQQRG